MAKKIKEKKGKRKVRGSTWTVRGIFVGGKGVYVDDKGVNSGRARERRKWPKILKRRRASGRCAARALWVHSTIAGIIDGQDSTIA
eukprot:3138651-Pyramimonas_sp.AAC.1